MFWRVLNHSLASPAPAPSALALAASLSAALKQTDALTPEVQRLADGLVTADLSQLDADGPRLAFWVNVYNALMRHALLAFAPTGSVVTNLLLFERACYLVGGHRLSLNDIEHGVLRRNARALPFFCRRFSRRDARQALMVGRLDPRIHFALNCGAVSCPPVRTWDAGRLDAQLTQATEGYLRAFTQLDRARQTVTLSRLLFLYAADFGTRADAVRFTARHLEGDDAAWLEAHADDVTPRAGPYNWAFVTPAAPPPPTR